VGAPTIVHNATNYTLNTSNYTLNANVIVYNQWASNGGFGLGEIAVEGNELVFRTRVPDGSEAPARAVWRRVDADTFKVVRQHRSAQAEGWTDDVSVTYRRVKPTAS